MSEAPLKLDLRPPDPPHGGMPPLDPGKRPLSFFEFWPSTLFYAPVVAYWLYLSLRHGSLTLPTAANPGLAGGGLTGESKSAVLGAARGEAAALIAPFVRVFKPAGYKADEQALADAIAKLSEAGLGFPLVAKPDISCRGAGVRVIRDESALARYVVSFPGEAAFLVQKLIDLEGEAGIFYVREPDAAGGRITSMTLKYFPFVIGDGKRTLGELIAADPRAGAVAHLYRPRHKDRLGEILPAGVRFRLVFAGNHARGAIFKDGTAYVTDALRDRIDAIAKSIDGFYFGRFDIRFADFEALRRGEGMTIIEINGSGAESTHIWDSEMSLQNAYRTLFEQYRTAFRIGAYHKRRGGKPWDPATLIGHFLRERRLTALYPSTD